MNDTPCSPAHQRACTWAMTAHLSTLSLYLGLIPANLLLPYLIWRWQRDRDAFVAAHALAALNFQISTTLVGLVTALAAFAFPILWLPVMIVFTLSIAFIGRAADRARTGLEPNYPLAVRWIRQRYPA